jgi:hypothetical protein
MFPLSQVLKIAAGAALLALTAVSTPARAVELVDNLGPVGPHEPILAWVGSKRIIAFYQPDNGNCAVHVVVWDPKDVNAESTVGFEATLNPGGTTSIHSLNLRSLTLRCGDYAERLAAVNTDRQVASK